MINENIKIDLKNKARKNIKDILTLSLKLNKTEKVLVIYDTQNELTNILTAGYKEALTEIENAGTEFLDFDKSTKSEILEKVDTLSENDLVVMVQSSNFRLDDFRIRLHLFARKLKVIEHLHLYRNLLETYDVYIDSLSYDQKYLKEISSAIKSKLDNAENLTIKSLDTKLFWDSEMEEAKLNIGDYTGMQNIGGTFPIGEVFTEAKILENLNGEIYIYAYADEDFNVIITEPFKIRIESGLITGYSEKTPESFKKAIEKIKEYERPIVREIGFGLNRAITKERHLGDITAFERIHGLHLSIGEKHSVYKKENISTSKARFHVDIFPVATKVMTDKDLIFENKNYKI